MQFNVQKIGGQAIRHGNQGQADMIVDRKEHVTGYHTTLDSAVGAAKALATLHPGEQYGVFAIHTIIETTQPSFVEKILNENGEVVLKPAVTA